MSGNKEPKLIEATRNRGGGLIVGLMMAAMLICLGACTESTATSGGSEQAPGSFHVHIGGRMTDMFGASME